MLSEQLHKDQQATQQLLAGGRPEQIGQEIRRSIEPLVREVGGVAGTVGSALIQTGAAAQQMNASSASLQAITEQFGSAARELRQSQELLQQALRQLAQPNALPEWLGQLHETVGPLRNAGTQLGQHYQYNRDLLDTTQVLLSSWNEQGEQLALGAQTINNAFQQWSSEEAVARQQFSEQIGLQLNEIRGTINEFATGLNSLQHTVQRLAIATDAMQHSTDVSRAALSQLLNHQTSSQAQQQRAVETLGLLSERMAEREETLGAQLGILVENSRRLSEESSKSQQETYQQNIRALRDIATKIKQVTEELGSQYDKKLAKVAIHLETAQVRDTEMRQGLDDTLNRMPSQRMYQFQTVVLVILTLTALALLWR